MRSLLVRSRRAAGERERLPTAPAPLSGVKVRMPELALRLAEPVIGPSIAVAPTDVTEAPLPALRGPFSVVLIRLISPVPVRPPVKLSVELMALIWPSLADAAAALRVAPIVLNWPVAGTLNPPAALMVIPLDASTVVPAATASGPTVMLSVPWSRISWSGLAILFAVKMPPASVIGVSSVAWPSTWSVRPA